MSPVFSETEAGKFVFERAKTLAKNAVAAQLPATHTIAERILTGNPILDTEFKFESPEAFQLQAVQTGFASAIKNNRFKLAAEIATEFSLDRGYVLEALVRPIQLSYHNHPSTSFDRFVQLFQLNEAETSNFLTNDLKSYLEAKDFYTAIQIWQVGKEHFAEIGQDIIRSNISSIIEGCIDMRDDLLPGFGLAVAQIERTKLLDIVEPKLLRKLSHPNLWTEIETLRKDFENDCDFCKKTFDVEWSGIDEDERRQHACLGIETVLEAFMSTASGSPLSFKFLGTNAQIANARVDFLRTRGDVNEDTINDIMTKIVIKPNLVDPDSSPQANINAVVASFYMHARKVVLPHLGSRLADAVLEVAQALEQEIKETGNVGKSFMPFSILIASATGCRSKEADVRERVATIMALSGHEERKVVRICVDHLDYPLDVG